MTVADLQKYIRALADAIGTRAPAKDLADAAERMAPFAALPVAEFADLLALAREYRDTGKIPERPRKAAGTTGRTTPPRPTTPTAADLQLAVEDLHAHALEPAVTRATVEARLRAFEGPLKLDDLRAAARAVGLSQVPKTKKAAVDALVTYVMGRKGPVERADA